MIEKRICAWRCLTQMISARGRQELFLSDFTLLTFCEHKGSRFGFSGTMNIESFDVKYRTLVGLEHP